MLCGLSQSTVVLLPLVGPISECQVCLDLACRRAVGFTSEEAAAAGWFDLSADTALEFESKYSSVVIASGGTGSGLAVCVDVVAEKDVEVVQSEGQKSVAFFRLLSRLQPIIEPI